MRRDVLAKQKTAARANNKNAKPSPKHGQGAICARWVRCGRQWCRCMQGGPKHGPYFAQYWWHAGRRYKRYIRQDDAERVVVACTTRREAERDQRAQQEGARQVWRECLGLIREVERGEQ